MPKNCLIVEDNSISQEVFETHMETLGLEFRTASSGEEALRLCRDKIPDVVLLDWHMPGMDGFEFIDKLHSLNDGKADPTIVMCTCDSGVEKEIKDKNAHVNGFLVKPTRFTDLEAKFKELGVVI